jgi:hypothetical protein
LWLLPPPTVAQGAQVLPINPIDKPVQFLNQRRDFSLLELVEESLDPFPRKILDDDPVFLVGGAVR